MSKRLTAVPLKETFEFPIGDDLYKFEELSPGDAKALKEVLLVQTLIAETAAQAEMYEEHETEELAAYLETRKPQPDWFPELVRFMPDGVFDENHMAEAMEELYNQMLGTEGARLKAAGVGGPTLELVVGVLTLWHISGTEEAIKLWEDTVNPKRPGRSPQDRKPSKTPTKTKTNTK